MSKRSVRKRRHRSTRKALSWADVEVRLNGELIKELSGTRKVATLPMGATVEFLFLFGWLTCWSTRTSGACSWPTPGHTRKTSGSLKP